METTTMTPKSTRWDCDVQLWRGLPHSPPSFYGWPVPEVRDMRYYACHHCNTYVSEQDKQAHPCWDAPLEKKVDLLVPDEMDSGFDDNWDEEAKDEAPEPPKKYIIATEEVSEDGRCTLCTERFELVFDLELEEWVYMEAIIIDEVAVHEECHEVLSNQ